MKFHVATALALCSVSNAFAPSLETKRASSSSLSMVLEMPKQKKLAKIETLKIDSHYLRDPLNEVCISTKS